MELILGVSVAGDTARFALVGASAPESVIDESTGDISGAAAERLADAITDTGRKLTESGHRLAAIRVCWADGARGNKLQQLLNEAGLANVTLVSPSDAATAFVRNTAATAGLHTSALLYLDDDTAALTVVGADAANTSVIAIEPVDRSGPTAACQALLDRLGEEPGGAERLYLLSATDATDELTENLCATSPVPLQSLDGPALAFARGAALVIPMGAPAAVSPSPQTLSSSETALSPRMGEHLAYSMAEDSGPLSMEFGIEYPESDVPLQTPMAPLSHTNDPDEFDQAAPTAGRPRILLMGSTIAAVVVVGFAMLAVGVAVAVQPTVSEQAVRDYESVPGKYLPVMPGQGVEPVEDETVYLPPVVPVSDTRGGDRGVTTVPASGSNPYQTNARPGGGINVLPPPPPVGGVPMPPPPGGFRLSDWLPTGMTINLGPLVPGGSKCRPGDLGCLARVTGGCTEVDCIIDKFYCADRNKPCNVRADEDKLIIENCDAAAGPGCEPTTITTTCRSGSNPGCDKPEVLTGCTSPGDPACKPVTDLTTGCPTGSTCESPLGRETDSTGEAPPDNRTTRENTGAPDSSDGAPPPSDPDTRGGSMLPDGGTPPVDSDGDKPPFDISQLPEEWGLPPNGERSPPGGSADSDEPSERRVPPPPPVVSEPAIVAPLPPPAVEAPDPVIVAPPPPPVIEVPEPVYEPPARAPAPAPAPAPKPLPIPIPAPAPAPAPAPKLPKLPNLPGLQIPPIFGGGGGSSPGSGSGSLPITTVPSSP